MRMAGLCQFYYTDALVIIIIGKVIEEVRAIFAPQLFGI